MIKSLDIKGLFGLYDYSIPFLGHGNANVEILTGSNGLGKTTILTIISNLYNCRFLYFWYLPFESMIIGFARPEADDYTLSISKVQSLSDGSDAGDSQPLVDRVVFIFKKGNDELDRFSLLPSEMAGVDSLWSQIHALDKTNIDEIKMVSMFKWMNQSHGNNYHVNLFKVSGKSVAELNDFNLFESQMCRSKDKKATTPYVLRIKFTRQDLDAFMAGHMAVDKFEYTVGHDFVSRLTHNLKIVDQPRFNTYVKNDVEADIIGLYTLGMFKQTGLYRDISDWSNVNGVAILVS